MLAGAALDDGDLSVQENRFNKSVTSMIAQWCCEEVTAVEGQALAKILSSLNYTQIMNIFSQTNFNMKILQSCFVYIRGLYLMVNNSFSKS